MLDLRSIPLFRAKMQGMLRYADSFDLVTTSGTVSSYVFSCNGLYDPNISGTGHQPAGFDQMMLSYEHYCVIRSRCVITAINTTTGTAPSIGLSIRAAATPITNIQQILEDGLVHTDRLLPPSVQGSIKTMTIANNISQFAGVTHILDNDDYRGSLTSNPVEQSYFHVQLWSSVGNTSACSFEVVIEFEAVFTEPRTLSQSLSKVLIDDFKKADFASSRAHPSCSHVR